MLFDRRSDLFVVFGNHDSCKIRVSILFGWEELPWLSRTAGLWLLRLSKDLVD